jgi:hypothetical protein
MFNQIQYKSGRLGALVLAVAIVLFRIIENAVEVEFVEL